MQHAVSRSHALDDFPYQHANTELVDRAHIGDRYRALTHQFPFQRIDRADTEQIELIGADRDARLVSQ